MARFNVPYDGPPRGYGNSGSGKRYIAIHNTSNDAPPKSEASYAKRRTDSVSAHFFSDPSTIIQSLDTRYDAWHAGSRTGNRYAVAFEIIGYNSWSESYWRRAIDRVAPLIAEVCRTHKISPQWLSASQARDGRTTGFVTHDDMRRVWGGTTHTDPGPNFPRTYLMDAVRRELGTPTTPTPVPPTSDWTVKLIMSLPTVKRGSKGQSVKNVQGLLNAHGSRLSIDGIFGPKTESAVRSYQKSRKLLVDGIVGRQTYTSLITR